MRIKGSLILVALSLSLSGAGAPLHAQDPLSGVGPRTEVRSVAFEFEGKHVFQAPDLASQIATRGQGSAVWLRKALGVLPLVPPVTPAPFDPLELQRDVVRLREYYQAQGFLHADVRYDVRFNAKSDLVWVTFRIREGPAIRVRSLEFVGVDTLEALPPDLREPWRRQVRKERKRAGRFGDIERQLLADSTNRWFRDRGYPLATARVVTIVDTVANQADVDVEVEPGKRARIAAIEVEGNKTVPAHDLTRSLGVEPGDWYSTRELEKSRLELTQLQIVRLAVFDAPQGPIVDSAIPVRLRVTENPPRLITGDAGFSADGGLGSQIEWTHRAFLGGVRTLTVGAVAQTGLLAFEDPPQRLYRLGVQFFQPYVGHRRLSATAGPFVEYRDDSRDRSSAYGIEASLVYATAPLRSISLSYALSRRYVYDYGFGAGLNPITYLPLLGLARPGAIDTLASVIQRSTVTLQGSYGWVDQLTYPRKGYVLRPRVGVTVPSGLNSSEYLLFDLGASGFVPLSRRFGLAFRGGAGRIYPFGKTATASEFESPFVSLLRLDDVTFTAGGTRDVRGWGTQLVGPKLPQVETETVDGVTRNFANHYTPVGGLARITASAELRMPLPGFGDKWELSLFADGGRIWSPENRFKLNAGLLDQDAFYTAVGTGVTFVTVVGAVQFAVGYKLNPSALDVRDPNDVFNALVDRQPITTAPVDNRHRIHLHFALGTTF